MSSARLHIFIWYFVGFLALFLCFAAPHLHAQSAHRLNSSTPAVNIFQSNPDSPPNNQQPREPTQTETDQYRLSRERYEKAVSYSRAGYTLYFISYFVSVAVLLLILRLVV